jgi:hypothetical protein
MASTREALFVSPKPKIIQQFRLQSKRIAVRERAKMGLRPLKILGAVFYARSVSQSASHRVPHFGKQAAIRYRKAMPYRYSDLPTSSRFPSF